MRPIHQLESALRAWETSWLLANTLKIQKDGKDLVKRPIIHWQEFRSFLLKLHDSTCPEKVVDVRRFENEEGRPPLHPTLELLPSALTAWCANSRRVFTLTEELQLLLGATSLKSVTLDDLHQPFNTYAIELPTPIRITSNGIGQEFNLIVASFNLRGLSGQTPLISLHLFNKKLADYVHMSRHEFDRIVAHSQSPSRKPNDLLKAYWARTAGLCCDREMVVLNITPDCAKFPVTEVVSRATREQLETYLRARGSGELPPLHEQMIQAFDYALRVTAGLCLYLQTTPNNTNLVSPWTNTRMPKISGIRRGQGITNEAHVCSVSTQFRLSKREVEVFREACASGFEGVVNPHFRMGYWARPKGLGKDPTAPKTVWHRPTIVNAHLLQGGLPHGSTVGVG